MAKTATLTLSLTVLGDGMNEAWAPAAALTNPNAPAPTSITFAVGANTIAVPSNAKGFVCVPPTSSSNAKALKGVSGDTGVPMGRATATAYSFDETVAPPATVVVTSAAIETVDWYWR